MTLTGLNVSDVVNVQVNLSPLAAQFRNFGALLILGDSDVIDVNERMREYTSLSGVEEDFGTTAPESKAADLFFSQKPQPAILYIGRWAQADTKGLLRTGVNSPSQQLLPNFTGISSGAFMVLIDGIPYSITGIDLTQTVNLNGVAAAIQVALNAAASGTTFVWSSEQQRYTLESPTSGVNSSVGYMNLPTATGYFLFASNPLNNATITVNGTLVTFVTGTPTSAQVKIGDDLPATLLALQTYLNASTDNNINKMTYHLPNVSNGKIYCISKIAGTPGNNYSLVASAATVSGATLAGGTGTDLSALVNGSLATGASPPANGIVAETGLQSVETFDDLSGLWYGAMFAATNMPTVADLIACAGYIEGASRSHIFGITSSDPLVLASNVSSDICSQLKTLGYERTFSQYSTSSPYAIASAYGRGFTVNFNANNSVITLKFKQEPGVTPELITEIQAATLKAKHCNVFVEYQNDTAIIQEGVMANGFFFDEVMGTDWLQNVLQTNLYNVLYQSPTKIPQTDPGIHILVNECNDVMEMSVYNGLVAPGKWNVAGFGQLVQGAYLKKGYYVWVQPVALQSQADREARKAPPIQIAAKLAGAVHFAYVIVTVNR